MVPVAARDVEAVRIPFGTGFDADRRVVADQTCPGSAFDGVRELEETVVAVEVAEDPRSGTRPGWLMPIPDWRKKTGARISQSLSPLSWEPA